MFELPHKRNVRLPVLGFAAWLRPTRLHQTCSIARRLVQDLAGDEAALGRLARECLNATARRYGELTTLVSAVGDEVEIDETEKPPE